MNGAILVDKPPGLTSHDVVNRWRKLAGTKRAGHLGTLDPMATGLLVLVTGTATRLAQFFSGSDKTYIAEIRLGFISDTYDAEGNVSATNGPIPGDLKTVEAALQDFRGSILQTPPIISAKKIAGVPAYKLARKNIEVKLEAVPVIVKKLEPRSFEGRTLDILIECSAGTYVRSIANDLGRALGCGAILSRLRRITSGPFQVEDARTLEQLQQLAADTRLSEAIVCSADLLPEIPSVYIDEVTEVHVRNGREFRSSPFVVRPGEPLVKAVSFSGELVAIGSLRFPNVYHPSTVL